MTKTFTAIARLANRRPWAVLATMIVLAAILGTLAVIGAISLIIYGAAWKWCLFAAIALAVIVSK